LCFLYSLAALDFYSIVRLCLAVAVHGAKVGVENSMANQLSALARDHDAVIDELTDKHDRTLKLHDSQWQVRRREKKNIILTACNC